MQSKTYPSDLSDAQWEQLKDFVAPGKMGRPRTINTREVINAILYVVKTGCQWRALPSDSPHWKNVYSYFLRWRNNGKWKEIHDSLREKVRVQEGKEPTPSAAIIDSQTGTGAREWLECTFLSVQAVDKTPCWVMALRPPPLHSYSASSFTT